MRWMDGLLSVSLCLNFISCSEKSSPGNNAPAPAPSPALTAGPALVDQQTGVVISMGCSAEFLERCNALDQDIAAAQERLNEAKLGQDPSVIYRAQLELNEWIEVREAYGRGVEDVAAIHQRYESLKAFIIANPESPDTGFKLTYGPDELIATREVLNDFGELTLAPSEIQEVGGAPVASTIFKIPDQNLPWSAYWYPKRDDVLFAGNQASLLKLDKYFAKAHIDSHLVQWEKDHFDANAAEWEGLCDAWALASTMTKEPREAVTVSGIDFQPSDLKAIAIKYFEGYGPKVYGRRYQGSASTDGMIQDLRPEAFHKLVEEVIGKQQKPIIVDEDPGPEVWSKPLYRMSFKYFRDPEYKDAVLVKAYPWMTRQRASVSDDVTKPSDLAAPLYEYRLFHEPDLDADGRYRVIAGEWIRSSINFHPDMVYLPGSPQNGNQGNAEMRKNHEDVRKLLVTVGMLVDSI